MFEKLKSLLSNNVSPGANNVSIAPFSFLIGSTIAPQAFAGEDALELARIARELDSIAETCEAGDYRTGLEQLQLLRHSIQVK